MRETLFSIFVNSNVACPFNDCGVRLVFESAHFFSIRGKSLRDIFRVRIFRSVSELGTEIVQNGKGFRDSVFTVLL